MAESFAMSVNAVHIHTSAKNNEGIDNLFQTIAANIVKKNKPAQVAPANRQNIRILDDDEVQQKSGCCK